MPDAIIIEQGESSFFAYVPNLPSWVSVGDTLDEVKAATREAIPFHLEGMRADGPVSQPNCRAEYVELVPPIENERGRGAEAPAQ